MNTVLFSNEKRRVEDKAKTRESEARRKMQAYPTGIEESTTTIGEKKSDRMIQKDTNDQHTKNEKKGKKEKQNENKLLSNCR